MSKSTNIDPRAVRSAHLQWIALGDLHVNPRAQREFRQTHADSILADFDIDKFQVPHVNHRDSRYFVMDGQHGVDALRRYLGEDEAEVAKQKLQVWVYEGLSEEQEADMFLALNKKLTVGAMPKFLAAVTAGYAEETDIDRIVRAQGCRVSPGKMSGAIGAVTALKTIYKNHGASTLARTISTVRDSYGDEGYESTILRGVAMVIDRYSDDELKQERLITRLRNTAGGSKGLLNRAEALRLATGYSKPQCVAAAVVETYNRGKGGKKLTPWWKATTDLTAVAAAS